MLLSFSRLDVAINRLPAPSIDTPVGKNSAASVAGPPSPEEPARVPPPATVVMIPLGKPCGCVGAQICDEQVSRAVDRHASRIVQPRIGGRLAISGGADKVPPPATVVMIPLGETLRMRWLSVSAMNRLPAPSIARPPGSFSCALVAGPPSPEKPFVPSPATVVMIPAGKTLRMRLLPVSAMNRLPAPSTATPWRLLSCALVAGPPSPESPSCHCPLLW